MEATPKPPKSTEAEISATGDIPVRGVSFPVLQGGSESGEPATLNRFFDVKVMVTVELGRIAMPIGDLLQLGPGSIVELDRTVSEPADVMAQGVRLGRGEIIVVDDRYAVRMLQIETEQNSEPKPAPTPAATAPAAGSDESSAVT